MLALRVLQPGRARALQAAREARRLQMGGDLRGALAAYDGLTGNTWERSEIQRGRRQVLHLLGKQVSRQAKRLRDAGQLAEALALYDGLPAELRDRSDMVYERTRVDDLMRKLAEKARRQQEAMHKQAEKARRRQAGNDVGRLRRAGDLIGALALVDALPCEIRELPDISQARNKIIDELVATARKQWRGLRRAGEFETALAVFDRLPPELRERPDILHERAQLVHLTGHLYGAADAFRKALAADPTCVDSWHQLATVLADLGRIDELCEHIDRMVANDPTFETLFLAAQVTRAIKLPEVAEPLLGRAMSGRATATAEGLVKAAHVLLDQGDHGRAIAVLNSEPVRLDPNVRDIARDLTGTALAQLRLAGRSYVSNPVYAAERADVIAVQSILAQRDGIPAAPAAPPRGIAVVVGSLGAGGAQRQTAELVFQICRLRRESDGPIVLLVLSRSESGPEFHAGKLAGLDVTIEFMSDFAADAGRSVSSDVAAKLSVLTPKHLTNTLGLLDRLKAHRPEVVVVMSDFVGVSVFVAAALTGVPRVVVSARNVAPPRRYADDLLRPAYRAALAQDHVSMVTNSAATAREFADWVGVPAGRIGVIHNGVDVDVLATQRDPQMVAAHRRALGIPASARIVGSIFQARRQKRHHLWIEAAAVIARRAPDVVFVLVGDLLDGADVSSALAHYRLEGRFHRPGIRSDVANWLDLMDVVLLTSAYEGTPNVLLEAQALGRPVVATDVGGSGECFLPGETGVLLSANPTPTDIADAVLRVLHDPGFAASARAQGPAFIRQGFDPDRMARAYLALCGGDEALAVDSGERVAQSVRAGEVLTATTHAVR